MSDGLPPVDSEFVSICDREFQTVFENGTAEEVEGARIRLVWALAHSEHKADNTRGLHMARQQKEQGSKHRNEYRYIFAGNPV
jgi:fission 1 protein